MLKVTAQMIKWGKSTMLDNTEMDQQVQVMKCSMLWQITHESSDVMIWNDYPLSHFTISVFGTMVYVVIKKMIYGGDILRMG